VLKGVAKGGGQVGQTHPRIVLAHPRIKVKHFKNKIHLQYLSIICLWFKIWPTPGKNHCYALDCALRNKLLVVALVIISSVTETKPPEFELSDQSLNLWAADK
jgi:hypothetical protein